MSKGRIAILLGILFAVGFLGARAVSQSSGKGPNEPAVERDGPARKTSRQKTSPGRGRVGFAAELKRLSAYEAAFLREDFEALLRGDRGYQAANAWAQTDPEGIFLWLQEHSHVELWPGIYQTLIPTWFKRDPEAAMTAYRTLDTSRRFHAWQGLVDLLFSDDPAVARAAGERAPEFFREIIPDGDSGTPRWFYDGQPSLEKILALPDSRAKDALIRTGMAGWASRDWKAARDWATSRPESERAAMLRSLFAWGIPRRLGKDPDGMAWMSEYLARDDNRDLRVRIGSSYAATLSRTDPAAAMTWVAENLGGASLAGAMSSIVSTQAHRDRNAAMEIVDGLPPGGVRLEAGRSLIIALTQIDPSAAYERARSMAQDGFDVSARVWGRVGTYVAIKQPSEAHAILADPPEGVPPALTNSLLSYLAIDHPQATLEWAAADLEGERRTEIMNRMMQSWRARDPVAAEKWERGERE